ncbi:hypothetical protein [Nocardiopsis sp. HUAS JQ3]|uniref:hypothetical protein n=1 Tax=Nocardiopsis sp. HUAS JQ3 TaxID=3061629 RepID=UPI0023A9BA1B|nr:hypothetical protein [Nocardiopsis sp. HUAS JQ3]WDZ91148.1 hypothetical protein PV789_00800 [Nocardiopsis sp. HUAS JQ3]
MPTFERVGDDGEVVERRHVPYRSRDLPALEKSATWRKVAEGYAPAKGVEPRPTVEEQRAQQRAERAAAAKAARAKTATRADATDGGG